MRHTSLRNEAPSDRGLVLCVSDIEATQTGTFRVYATAAEATTARTSEQPVSSSLSLTLNLDKSSAGSRAASALKNDVCLSLSLEANACARVSVSTVISTLTAAIVVTDESGQVLAITQMAAPADEETVTVGSVNRVAFEAETGATAPAGTSVLYTVGRTATDAFGNRLAVLRKPQRLSLPVPESVLLPGALPGDLKVAWWDGARWTVVPSATAVNEDGSYTVTANTDALGVFAVLYAPGAGRVQGFGGFSTQSENGDAAVGLGIFAGGSTAALARAVGLSGADGVLGAGRGRRVPPAPGQRPGVCLGGVPPRVCGRARAEYGRAAGAHSALVDAGPARWLRFTGAARHTAGRSSEWCAWQRARRLAGAAGVRRDYRRD